MKHFKRTKFVALLMGAGLVGVTGSALADDGSSIKTHFSGYGTLALTSIDKSDLQFRTSLAQSKGASNTPDLGTDSRLGLQGVVDFGSGMTVTGQLLAQRRRVDDTPDSNRDFDIGVEWLFAQYSVNPNLDLRLGRVVLPAFMISDSRNVGYSQPWLRAPLEVYGQQPLSNLDGLQANWRIPVGAAIFTVQPSYGKSSFNLSSGVPQTGSTLLLKGTTRQVGGLNVTFEYGDWLARLGQIRSTSPVSVDFLNGLVPNTDWDMKDNFTTMGLQYDNGQAIVMTEFARRRMNDVPASPPGYSPLDLIYWGYSGIGGKPLAKTESWYLAGGWHFGKFLPMLAYGRSTDQNVDPHTSTHSISASLRYDLMNNVALKAQWSQYQSKDGTVFVMPTLPANDKKVNVISAGLDFVF